MQIDPATCLTTLVLPSNGDLGVAAPPRGLAVPFLSLYSPIEDNNAANSQ